MGLEFLYLSQEDVKACGGLDMPATISDVEKALMLHAKGECVLPTKTVLRWGDIESEYLKGRINAMPAYVGGSVDMAGIKWIAGFPSNPSKHGLPRGIGLTILNDSSTGVPLAVMDGTLISAMRTGAVTAVAAKYLARSGSRIVGLIGAGVQNRTQLLALREVLPEIKEVKVFDVDESRADRFAAKATDTLGLKSYACASAEETVRRSDVVVSATTSKNPIVKREWLETGAFYAAIGGHECEYDVIRTADKIVVDNWEEIKHRGSQTLCFMYREGLIGDDAINAELGQVAIGEHPGRERDTEVIYFASVGMGIEDIVVAARIYRRAKETGRGMTLKLWEEPYAV